MLKNQITVDDVCALLNELLVADYNCVSKLLNIHEECNDKIADHPTVIVTNEQRPSIGFIGILNGLFGVRDDGMGPICIELDDKKNVVCVKPTPRGPWTEVKENK
jgi:hypothetical protein